MPHAEDAAARRAFIRAHHPDRGGDPEAFITGLAELGPPGRPPPDVGNAPVLAFRARRFRPAKWFRRARPRRLR